MLILQLVTTRPILLAALLQLRPILAQRSTLCLCQPRNEAAEAALREVLLMLQALADVTDWWQLSRSLQQALAAPAAGSNNPDRHCATVLALLDRRSAINLALQHAEVQEETKLGMMRGLPSVRSERSSRMWSQADIWWQLLAADSDFSQHADSDRFCQLGLRRKLLLADLRRQQFYSTQAATTNASSALHAARQVLFGQWFLALAESARLLGAGEQRHVQAALAIALQVAMQIGILAGAGVAGNLRWLKTTASHLQLVGQLLLRGRSEAESALLPVLLRLLLGLQLQCQAACLAAVEWSADTLLVAQRMQLRRWLYLQSRQARAMRHDTRVRPLLLCERRLIRHQLQHACQCLQQPSARISAELVTALTRLTLNVHASGEWRLFMVLDSLRAASSWALALQCVVPARLVACFALLADKDQPLLPWQLPHLLVRAWEQELAVRHVRHSGTGAASMTITLAASLGQLTTAGAFWQQVAAGAAPDPQRLQALAKELALLQRGAQRLGVLRIAALAAMLCQLYVRRQQGGEWPVALQLLLVRAHHRLLRMLDQAAAWQQVASAATLIEQLHTWLEAPRRAVSHCPPDGVSDSRQLNASMRRRLRSALQEQASDHDLLTLLGLLQSQDKALARLQQSSDEQ